MDFPCPGSRTNRSPTPDLTERSSCVILNRLRNDFTVADKPFIPKLYQFGYIYYFALNHIGYNCAACRCELYRKGYSVRFYFLLRTVIRTLYKYSRIHLRLAQQCRPNPKSAMLSRELAIIQFPGTAICSCRPPPFQIDGLAPECHFEGAVVVAAEMNLVRHSAISCCRF